MSGKLPTIVVPHDPTATRVAQALVDLGRRDRGLSVMEPGFDPAQLEAFFRPVEANDTVLVVHVLSVDDDVGIAESIEATYRALIRQFPALRSLRQWLVQLSGLQWSQREIDVVASVYAAAPEAKVAGIIVVGREVGASVAVSAEEEELFGAEAVHLLRTSASLEADLAQSTSVWLVGVSSVRYDGAEAADQLGLLAVGGFLADVSKPARASDPSSALGRRMVDDLDLGNDRDQLRLAASPDGGSVMSRIRAAEVFDAGAFDRIDVGDWPIAIEAAIDEVVAQRLRSASQQIERVAADREHELLDTVDRAVLSHFEECESIPSTADFVEGSIERLSECRRMLEVRRGETKPPGYEAELSRLRRWASHMPFGPAVMVRFALLAIGAMLLVIWPVGPWLHLGRETTRSVARGASIATIVLGWLFYLLRRRRLVRARDLIIRAVEHDARERLQRRIFDERLGIITALIGRLGDRSDPGSWRSRLDNVASACRLFPSGPDVAAMPAAGSPTSRFSVRLSAGQSQSERVPERERQAADARTHAGLLEFLISRKLVIDSESFNAEMLELASRQYQTLLAPSLAAHLAGSAASKDRATAVLSAELSPAIADPYGPLERTEVTRYFCAPDDVSESLLEQEPWGATMDGDERQAPAFAPSARRSSCDQNFVGIFHAYNATPIVLSVGHPQRPPGLDA